MGKRALRTNGFRRALAAFVLLATLVRAAIPAGYMIAPSTDGSSLIAITLCTGFGETEAFMDLATGEVFKTDPTGGHQAPDPSQHDHTPCVFAAATPVAIPISEPAIRLAAQDDPAIFARPATLVPGRGLVAPPPWATGPPAHA